MKLPFVGPAYAARSVNQDIQRTLNCYLELDNASPRAPVALYGTPGLLLKFTLGDAPVRGAIKQGAYSYWVAGDSVYRVDTSYNATLLGTIGTGAGQVGMASNGTEVLIVDGLAGWLATSSALTQITDVDFPNGVTRTAFQDGWFLVAGDGTQKLYINETPNTGSAWNGADFGSAEGSPDNIVDLISDHREVWLGGTGSFEVFVNTGNTDFPFERSGNTYIEHGIASAGTLAKLDNTVFWLGADDRGTGIVWRAQGYTPARISNHALEHAIQGYSTISDAFAFTYQQGGHGFYVLTFPTASKTWVYDVATNEWHERSWRDPDTNEDYRWRPNCYVFFNDEHLVGDFATGKVYALDLDTYSDNGDPIRRLRTTQSLNKGGKRLFFSNLIVDMETGVGLATGQGSDPQIMLRYSSDDGHSWSNIKTKSIGAAGEYAKVVRFGGSLGRTNPGKGRVWELSMTDPVRFALFGADVDVEEGA
jgi:hypothetical protein